ncbi:MAG: sigma-54-dependent Fis family transcriptional regulator, partial [Rhodobacteraceae bacterium]|nr:sigma-54-dependent Fis family transcriptional regulator [Paracoccaceae bacterium]
YMPLGSNTLKTVNVRIVAATNRNLEEQVEKGLMREDFFYRIQVMSVKVPPLRERKEDIPLLTEHFLEQYRTGGNRPTIPGKVAEALSHYDWPGNIRQLQNVLQRYLAVKRLDFLGPGRTKPIEVANISGPEVEQEGLGLQEALEAFEKQLIARTLEQQRWHRGKTASTLHIPPRTLYRKMKKHQLL